MTLSINSQARRLGTIHDHHTEPVDPDSRGTRPCWPRHLHMPRAGQVFPLLRGGHVMSGRHALHTSPAAWPGPSPQTGQAAFPTQAASRDAIPDPRAGLYRYGYRPAVTERSLHCALPGGLVRNHGFRAITWAWCGVEVHLANSDDTRWARWPACGRCRPGYENHLILRQLAEATSDGLAGPGCTEAELSKVLVAVAVSERLAAMHRDGTVLGDYGVDGLLLYRLSHASAIAVAYLDGAR